MAYNHNQTDELKFNPMVQRSDFEHSNLANITVTQNYKLSHLTESSGVDKLFNFNKCTPKQIIRGLVDIRKPLHGKISNKFIFNATMFKEILVDIMLERTLNWDGLKYRELRYFLDVKSGREEQLISQLVSRFVNSMTIFLVTLGNERAPIRYLEDLNIDKLYLPKLVQEVISTMFHSRTTKSVQEFFETQLQYQFHGFKAFKVIADQNNTVGYIQNRKVEDYPAVDINELKTIIHEMNRISIRYFGANSYSIVDLNDFKELPKTWMNCVCQSEMTEERLTFRVGPGTQPNDLLFALILGLKIDVGEINNYYLHDDLYTTERYLTIRYARQWLSQVFFGEFTETETKVERNILSDNQELPAPRSAIRRRERTRKESKPVQS